MTEFYYAGETRFDDLPEKEQVISRIMGGLAKLPESMRATMFNYLVYGLQPGDFLKAVLSNNLKEAVARGDETNLGALVDYVRYLYNDVPIACWGSAERVDAWLKETKAIKFG